MPLYQLTKSKVDQVPLSEFESEKALQGLIESNLGAIFNCRFIATEFSTGDLHGGRIDTLALSEDGNPVIIEYKKVVSSELVLQSLYYVHWLEDHAGDFTVAARKALGNDCHIDMTSSRVICIAPGYKKFDLHAVQVMRRAIELWTYRKFANDTFFLEQIQGVDSEPATATGKNPVMIAAGKKAAITRSTSTWTVEEKLTDKSENIRQLFTAIQDFLKSLNPVIEEAPKKLYVAYRTTQNIVCVEVQKKKILLFLKLDPKKHSGPADISRDVSAIGHFGTGNLEITLRTVADLERAKPYLRKAYDEIGA